MAAPLAVDAEEPGGALPGPSVGRDEMVVMRESKKRRSSSDRMLPRGKGAREWKGGQRSGRMGFHEVTE